jgi:hypothetical protein
MLYSLVIYLCIADKCTLDNNGGIEYIGRGTSKFECDGTAQKKLNSLRDAKNGHWNGICVSARILNQMNLKEM